MQADKAAFLAYKYGCLSLSKQLLQSYFYNKL